MEASRESKQQVFRALDLFNSAVFGKKLEDVVALFTTEAEPLLVGSGAGAIANGAIQLRAYFKQMFDESLSYSFRWNQLTADVYGDVAWLFADGYIVTASDAGLHEHPYRLTGVLLRRDSQWLWTHYHGSEPAG